MRTLLVARTDLRRRLRNRSAVITAVVAPLGMAVVFGLLIGGTDDLEFRLGVVDRDDSAVSGDIVAGLRDQPDDSPLRVEEVADLATARQQVDDGDLGAAVVLAPGLGAARADEPVELVVLRSPDRAVSGEVARAVAQSIAATFDRVGLALATVDLVDPSAGGGPPPDGLVDAAATAEPAVVVVDAPAGGSEIDATAFFGASMSILFMFFTVGLATRSLLDERHAGILDRLLATPTAPGALVGGKVASVSALAFGGLVVTWVATTLVFDADWGPPLTVLAVIVATVVAVGGVSLFVTSLARTPQQADVATSTVAFALALAGGNFVGPGEAPGLLATLRPLTPNGQALTAFTEAAADRATIAEVAPGLAVMVAVGVVLGGVGLARARRTVAP